MITTSHPSAWPPVAGRSVLRAVGFGLLAAVGVAAAHAAFVAKTEYEAGWISMIVGAVVGLTVNFAKPEMHRIWVGATAAALTLVSLLLSEYLLVHYGDFVSVTEDPFLFLFWGLALFIAGRAGAANDSDEEEPRATQDTEMLDDDPVDDGAELDVDQTIGERGPEGAPNDGLESPASGQASGSEPVWNPSTVVGGPGSSDAMSPPSHGFGERRTRPDPELGVSWFIAGASIVALAVGLALVGVLHEWWAGQDANRRAAAGTNGLVDYADLKVGNCVRDMQSEEADLGLDVVDCASESHTDEVFGTFTLPRQSWPGEKRVDDLGWRGCDARFKRYVGTPVDDTDLDVYMTPPVKIGWPEDRVVVCTVSDSPEPHRGSLRNSNR